MSQIEITTESQFKDAFTRLDALWENAERTADEEQEFTALLDAIEQYEELHYPIEKPTLEEAEQFRKEQMGES